MNYGGDAADQIVRYSMEGMEHTLRISGSIAKNLAVLIVAVMKDQKKTRGKTNLLRMLKEQRAMKFFTIPHDRLREFAGEAKSRGLLYVVIRDKKNPQFPEIMVFADDAAKVNRVLDKMNVRQAAYTIRNHMERNFGEQEQTFSKDDFSFEEPPKQAPKKEKKEKQPER